MERKLKPVVYTTNYFKRGTQNTTQQMFLLKALQVTQDPKKLKEMIGVKTVAEVYRTLDKLAMRREYHEALARIGISFDYIVEGIKHIADNGFKDADKLNAFKTLLKSVGMDEYKENTTAVTGTWEEALLKRMEEEKKDGGEKRLQSPIRYEVDAPSIPESAKKKQEMEDDMTSSIYDNK
jgi:hypothetical protein